MPPRIPIFTSLAILRRLRAALHGARHTPRSAPAQAAAGQKTQAPPAAVQTAGSKLWHRCSRLSEEECTAGDVRELRRHWLAQPLWSNARDLLVASAAALPSQQLLRRFFADTGGSPVGGGTFHRETFDERLAWASITANHHTRPPTEGFAFSPIDAAIPELEEHFGELTAFRRYHNDDDTVFVPQATPCAQLAFVLSGAWERRPDGSYLHRFRMSSEEEIVAGEASVPESVEMTYRPSESH